MTKKKNKSNNKISNTIQNNIPINNIPINNNENAIVNNSEQDKYVHFNIQLPPNTTVVSLQEYNNLKKENTELKVCLEQYKIHKSDLLNIIEQKDKNIDELKKENETLKNMLNELKKQNKELKDMKETFEKDLNNLKNKNNIFEALSKLNDCDKLANDTFKKEYRLYFKLGRYNNNVPNIGQFIEYPPNEYEDKEDFDFWKYFCNKYPDSNNIGFRDIYKRISKDRVDYGAHYAINDIDDNEFEELMKIAIPDIYNTNKKLCNDYKRWLFLF